MLTNILLVEDNPVDVDLIQRALTNQLDIQFQIEVAEELGEAQLMIQNDKFDIVLTDLNTISNLSF